MTRGRRTISKPRESQLNFHCEQQNHTDEDREEGLPILVWAAARVRIKKAEIEEMILKIEMIGSAETVSTGATIETSHLRVK